MTRNLAADWTKPPTTPEQLEARSRSLVRSFDPYFIIFNSETLGCEVMAQTGSDDDLLFIVSLWVVVDGHEVEFTDHLTGTTLQVLGNEARVALEQAAQESKDNAAIQREIDRREV